MKISLRACLLEALIGTLFLLAPGLGEGAVWARAARLADSRVTTPPTSVQPTSMERSAIVAARREDKPKTNPTPPPARGQLPPSIGTNISPDTALTRAPPTETCRHANRRYRWRGCRETRSTRIT